MPVLLPKNLPATETLFVENNDFTAPLNYPVNMADPLKIVVLNLMPTKVETETQLCRLLNVTPLNVKLTFLTVESYESKNIDRTHLENFYVTLNKIKHQFFDGIIITGAPIEKMRYEDVAYWQELCHIFAWVEKHARTSLYLCWGAMAALYYFYGVGKKVLNKKIFGVYAQHKLTTQAAILTGLDDEFFIPHSRYTVIDENKVNQQPELEIIAAAKSIGASIIRSKNNKQHFFLGHSEYARETLHKEFLRDRANGLDTDIPLNYYRDNNPNNPIKMQWQSTGQLLFSNWLNNIVYPMKLRESEE